MKIRRRPERWRLRLESIDISVESLFPLFQRGNRLREQAFRGLKFFFQAPTGFFCFHKRNGVVILINSIKKESLRLFCGKPQKIHLPLGKGGNKKNRAFARFFLSYSLSYLIARRTFFISSMGRSAVLRTTVRCGLLPLRSIASLPCIFWVAMLIRSRSSSLG